MIREIVFEAKGQEQSSDLFFRWLEQNRDAELVKIAVAYRQNGERFDGQLARFLRELRELA